MKALWIIAGMTAAALIAGCAKRVDPQVAGLV